jgi:hypothetical protein
MKVSMMGMLAPGSGRGSKRLLGSDSGRAVRCPAAEIDDSVKTTVTGKVVR